MLIVIVLNQESTGIVHVVHLRLDIRRLRTSALPNKGQRLTSGVTTNRSVARHLAISKDHQSSSKSCNNSFLANLRSLMSFLNVFCNLGVI